MDDQAGMPGGNGIKHQFAGRRPQRTSALLSELTGVPAVVMSSLKQQALFREQQSARRAARASIYRPALRASMTSALTGGTIQPWRLPPLDVPVSKMGSLQVPSVPPPDRTTPSNTTAESGAPCSKPCPIGHNASDAHADGAGSAHASAPHESSIAQPLAHGQQTCPQPERGGPEAASPSVQRSPLGRSRDGSGVTSQSAHCLIATSSSCVQDAPVPNSRTGLAPDVEPDLIPSPAWNELASAVSTACVAVADLSAHQGTEAAAAKDVKGLKPKLDSDTRDKLVERLVAARVRLVDVLGALPAHRLAARLRTAGGGSGQLRAGCAAGATGPATNPGDASLLVPVLEDSDAGRVGRAVALVASHMLFGGWDFACEPEPGAEEGKPNGGSSQAVVVAGRRHLECALLLTEALLAHFGLPVPPYPELLGIVRAVATLRLALPPASVPNLGLSMPEAPGFVTSINLSVRFAREGVADYLSSLDTPPSNAAESDSGAKGRQGNNQRRLPWHGGGRPDEGELFASMSALVDPHVSAVAHAVKVTAKKHAGSGSNSRSKKAAGPAEHFARAYLSALLNLPSEGHDEAPRARRASSESAHKDREASKGRDVKEPDVESLPEKLIRLALRGEAERRGPETAGSAAEPLPRVFGNLGAAVAATSAFGQLTAASAAVGGLEAGRGDASGSSGRYPFGDLQQRMQFARILLEAALDGRQASLVAIGDTALLQAVLLVANASLLRQTPLPFCAGGSAAGLVEDGPILLRFELLRRGQLTAPEGGAAAPSQPAAASSGGPGPGGAAKGAVAVDGPVGQECGPMRLEDCLREAALLVTLLPCGSGEKRRIAERRRAAMEMRRRLQEGAASGKHSGPSDFEIRLPERWHNKADGREGLGFGLLRECIRVFGCAQLTCEGCCALQEAAILLAQAQASEGARRGAAERGAASADQQPAGDAEPSAVRGLEVVAYVHDARRDVRIGEARARILAATPLRPPPQHQRQRPGIRGAGQHGSMSESGSAHRAARQEGCTVDEGWEGARRVALNRELCGLLGLANTRQQPNASVPAEVKIDPRACVTLFVLRQPDAR